MALPASVLLLPALLLSLLSRAAGCLNEARATAVRKLSPDIGEKILPEYLAFALDDEIGAWSSNLQPAFVNHRQLGDDGVLRRALAKVQQRSTCPVGMNNCAREGAPNMCCQQGTYCTRVPDSAAKVACCPQGSHCGGAIGSCPSGATSCPASLGAGCCISGYRCEGTACVPSATPGPVTTTTVEAGPAPPPETLTWTTTTTVAGTPSTVIVTLTVTHTSTPDAASSTQTRTEVVTAPTSDAATGSAPWRPTGESSSSSSRQTGCPTGFYGCLATHGGGCCRTGRDCETDSCPAPPPSKTVNSSGPTIVVPAHGPTATARCADGWFLCAGGGPNQGCCPHGYECGTASCHGTSPSQTSSLDKQQAYKSAAAMASNNNNGRMRWVAVGLAVGAAWLGEVVFRTLEFESAHCAGY